MSRTAPKLDVTPVWVGGSVVGEGGCAGVWTRSSPAYSLVVEMDWKSKASAPLIAMAVVEIDAFESGRLSTRVSLGGGAGAGFSTAESKCATSD